MENTQHVDQTLEIKKMHQLLSKNIEDFKYLVLCNMRLEQKSRSANDTLHLDINRISNFQENTPENASESLEEWVSREFAPKSTKKEEFTYEVPNETLEQWVARQKIKTKNTRSTATIIDFIEEWLMNEAKKDLFEELDAKYGGPEGLSSEYIRELGTNLISLADKLDKIKSKTSVAPAASKRY